MENWKVVALSVGFFFRTMSDRTNLCPQFTAPRWLLCKLSLWTAAGACPLGASHNLSDEESCVLVLCMAFTTNSSNTPFFVSCLFEYYLLRLGQWRTLGHGKWLSEFLLLLFSTFRQISLGRFRSENRRGFWADIYVSRWPKILLSPPLSSFVVKATP